MEGVSAPFVRPYLGRAHIMLELSDLVVALYHGQNARVVEMRLVPHADWYQLQK